MNNGYLITEDVLKDEVIKDPSPELRARAQILTDIIEALQKVGGSSHWNVLQKYVFEVDLNKAKSRLAKEKDTTEMFRLQGEIKSGEKLHFESLITKYQNELTTIRKNLNG